MHPLRWTFLSAAAGVALALPLVAVVTPRFARWIYLPTAMVVGATAVASVAHVGLASPPFADLAMGILLAAPVGIFAVMAEHRASLSTVMLGLFGGLSILELDLATLRALPSVQPAGPTAWSTSAATVVGEQLSSLSQWAAAAGVAPPPLAYVGDAVFDALVLLAASGVLLSWLAFDARLGASAVQGPRGSPPPPGPAWTGVRSLVVATGAILAFEEAAALNPVLALAGTVVAVAATSVGIAWLVQSRVRSSRNRPVAAGAGPQLAD